VNVNVNVEDEAGADFIHPNKLTMTVASSFRLQRWAYFTYVTVTMIAMSPNMVTGALTWF
jgi:hypothetical protein